MIELIAKGCGEFVVGFIDARGKILLKKRMIVSGDPRVGLKSRLPLALTTHNGDVAVVPVLIRQKSRTQQVTFDGVKPSVFTASRTKELGIAPKTIAKAVKAAQSAGLAVSSASSMVTLSP